MKALGVDGAGSLGTGGRAKGVTGHGVERRRVAELLRGVGGRRVSSMSQWWRTPRVG